MEIKFRLCLSFLISCMVVVVGHIFYYNSLRAAPQEPRRWLSGDTLWMEIDSLPALPSSPLHDSLGLHLLPLHTQSDMRVDMTPSRPLPRVEFNYYVPYWSIYRRSVTVWGITFSTGQPSPLMPYPAGRSQDATVLSFPLQPPR